VLLELEWASRRPRARPGRFLDRLVAVRDTEGAKLPTEARERLERIDALVQAHGRRRASACLVTTGSVLTCCIC
jgi:hypothetical protein